MKKILLATGVYPPDIGGPAKYAQEIHNELERQGHAAPVVAYSSLERHLPIGVRHVVYFLRLIRQLQGVDVIFAFDTWSVGIPALLASTLLHKKLMVRIGGDFLWEQYIERTGEPIKLSDFYSRERQLVYKERVIKWGTQKLLWGANAIIFNTSWQRHIWENAYMFDKKKVHVVENFFAPVQTVLPPHNEVFVASGRSIKLKNTDLLLKIFKKVKEVYPHAQLDTEQLSPAKNQERLKSAYAIVVSSVSEINPNSIIEGLAYGKPFIAPQDSGIYEKLQHLGVFVDTTDTHALEAALEQMLIPAFYQAKVEAIKNFTYAHSWREITNEIIDIAKRI